MPSSVRDYYRAANVYQRTQYREQSFHVDNSAGTSRRGIEHRFPSLALPAGTGRLHNNLSGRDRVTPVPRDTTVLPHR